VQGRFHGSIIAFDAGREANQLGKFTCARLLQPEVELLPLPLTNHLSEPVRKSRKPSECWGCLFHLR
jgi:hypothetical protein